MQHLLRKQIILVIAFLGIATAALSQNDEVYQPNHDDLPYYLGMSFGVSNSYLSFNRGQKLIDSATGLYIKAPTQYISLGLTGTLRLSKHVLLRANPNLLINGTTSFVNVLNLTDKFKYSITSTIIDLPIALKIESERYNAFRNADLMRHYVLAGVKLGYDIGSDQKAPTVLDKDLNTVTGHTPNLIRGTNLALELGLGLSFFLRYATLSPEFKFSYGINNLAKNSPYYSTININGLDKITSNFFYFTIHIEN